MSHTIRAHAKVSSIHEAAALRIQSEEPHFSLLAHIDAHSPPTKEEFDFFHDTEADKQTGVEDTQNSAENWLPAEVLLNICNYVDAKTLCNMAAVGISWDNSCE